MKGTFTRSLILALIVATLISLAPTPAQAGGFTTPGTVNAQTTAKYTTRGWFAGYPYLTQELSVWVPAARAGGHYHAGVVPYFWPYKAGDPVQVTWSYQDPKHEINGIVIREVRRP